MAKRKGKGRRRATAAQIRARARFARLYGGKRSKRRGGKRRSRRRSAAVKRSTRRGSSAAPIVVLGPGGSFTRKRGKGRFKMARKRRSVRRRRSGRRGFGGGGKLGGFFSREVLGTVGGAAVAGFLGPKIARYLPASWANSAAGRIGAAAVVGAVGFLILKRYSRPMALGWAAASVAPAVSGELARATGGVSGYGSPDGLDYLPELSGGLDTDEPGIYGMGEFEADAIEL